MSEPLPTTGATRFVLGAAARIVVERMPAPETRRPSRTASVASALAIAALVALSVVPLRGHAATYAFGGPAIAALACVLVIAWRSWHVVQSPPLRLLAALGTTSYGLYLWNYPLTLWLRPSLGDAAAGRTPDKVAG